MGCCGSKKPKKPECSKTADERTGLSECDRNLLKSTWKTAMPDDDVKLKNGVEFFIQFFTTYPSHQEAFPDFAGVELTELGTMSELEEHAKMFMNTIESWVDACDDADRLFSLFGSNNEKHHGIGLSTQQFEDMDGVLLPYLRSIMGAACTADVEEAWNKLFKASESSYKQYVDDNNQAGAPPEDDE